MYTKAGYNVVKTDSVLVLLMLQRRKHLMCKKFPALKNPSELDFLDPDMEISSQLDTQRPWYVFLRYTKQLQFPYHLTIFLCMNHFHQSVITFSSFTYFFNWSLRSYSLRFSCLFHANHPYQSCLLYFSGPVYPRYCQTGFWRSNNQVDCARKLDLIMWCLLACNFS